MEPAPKLTGRSFEEQRTYKIEHFPGFDMVVNLDYPDKNQIDIIMRLIKESRELDDLEKLIYQIRFYRGSLINNINIFFVKEKRKIREQLQFIKDFGDIEEYLYELDPLSVNLSKESRYARIGILSEIILSKKVKKIIISEEVQQLSKQYGFSDMDLAEPIVGIVGKGGRKFLIYKNISNTRTMPVNFYLGDFSKDLRKIFVKNGIQPSDLRNDQFIFTSDSENNWKITLIDIEAYTEIKK